MASPFASLCVSDPIPLPFDERQWIKVRKLTGKQWEQVQCAEKPGDRWSGFDRYKLIEFGLHEWSYPQAIGPDAINDLDDDAVDFIALKVLRHTKPWVFEKTPEEAEADEKNASGPSTAT